MPERDAGVSGTFGIRDQQAALRWVRDNAAAFCGDPSRVLAGTDCGFDTSAGWGRVAEDVVWAKLRSLAEGARLASQGVEWVGGSPQQAQASFRGEVERWTKFIRAAGIKGE